MSSQLKPWERARMGGVGVGGGGGSNSIGTAVASTTVVHPPSSSQTQAQTQNSSYSSSSSQQPSSLPSSSFGYNRYGLAGTSSGYGSYGSYGSYGGYGSSSSGYGLGYGGFSSYASSPYSSSFGYGASSLMSPGMGVGGIDFQGGLIGNGLVLMNQIMEGFSRFSYLFGATFEAFRNAVMSLLGMYKGLSPILGFAKSFTIFKLLRALLRKMHSLFMWVCGVNQVQRPGNWDSEFASTASPISSSAPLFIRAGVGALFAIVTPAIIMKLIKFVRGFFHGNISSVGNNAGLLQQQPQQGRSNVTIGTEYVASHDFEGKDSTELSFKRGDRVIVLDHNACPGQELWADAEMGGKKGKVPMNFFASSSSSSSSSSSTSTSSPTTQSSTATTSSYTSFTPSSYSTSSITTPISTSSSSSYLSSNKTHPVTSF